MASPKIVLGRGSGPVGPSRPPFGRHARRVQRRPRPVDPLRLSGPIQQGPLQPAPHARLLPGAQPPPACRSRPTAHLLGEHLPGDARLEKDDARECRSVGHAGPSAARLGRLRRRQRFDGLPQLVRHQFFRHDEKRSIEPPRFCNALLRLWPPRDRRSPRSTGLGGLVACGEGKKGPQGKGESCRT
jgi:hypothetical protein